MGVKSGGYDCDKKVNVIIIREKQGGSPVRVLLISDWCPVTWKHNVSFNKILIIYSSINNVRKILWKLFEALQIGKHHEKINNTERIMWESFFGGQFGITEQTFGLRLSLWYTCICPTVSMLHKIAEPSKSNWKLTFYIISKLKTYNYINPLWLILNFVSFSNSSKKEKFETKISVV